MVQSPSPLTFGERLGDFIILEASITSILTVLTFYIVAFVNSVWQRRAIARGADQENQENPNIDAPEPPRRKRWRFLSLLTDYYFLILISFDLILSIGQILDARWIGIGIVIPGAYCMAQGILQQVGDVGTALTSLVIAFHTFAVLFFRWHAPPTKLLPFTVFMFICLFLLFSTLVPALTRSDFWDVAGDWCWISPRYSKLQVGLEYVVFWITALVSFLLYVLLFFCLRGNIVVEYNQDGDWGKGKRRIIWWQERDDSRAFGSIDPDAQAKVKEEMANAKRMLAFPVAYTFIILPSSVFRLMEDVDHSTIPSAGVAVAGTIYALSGFMNVSLYLVSRPYVFGFIRRFISGDESQTAAQGPPPEAGQQQEESDGPVMDSEAEEVAHRPSDQYQGAPFAINRRDRAESDNESIVEARPPRANARDDDDD